MRVFVKVSFSKEARTFAILCSEPATCTVGWLKRTSLERCLESLGPGKEGKGPAEADQYQLALSSNGALLSDNDAVGEALQEGEFLTLCKPCRLLED